MKLSLAQMDLALGEPQKNFAKVRDWTSQAKQHGSQLIVLPELWSTAYDLENWQKHATPLGQGLFASLAELAAEFKIAIAGSLLEMKDDRAYNTFTLYDDTGKQTGVYRKVHLVPMLDEPKWLAAGNESALVETAWGKTGLAICYDLRFVELIRKYALGGAQMLILPAEWPAKRTMHWQTLLRARAIENQMYVVAVNRVGETKGEVFGGRSAVIDPWGETIIEGDDQEALLHTEIDLNKVAEVRQRIPIFKDRREDVY